MRLHRDMSIQMVQSAIRLLAAIPSALVHALNFFIPPAWSLVLLRAWDWDERVDSRQRMTTLVALVRISLLKQRKVSSLQAGVVQERPLQALEGLKMLDGHMAA